MAARRTSPASSTPRWRTGDRPPVKILYSREESLRFHPKRHATLIRIKTGARRDGTLTAVEAELYGDSGAYASLGEKVMTRATTHATGPYVVGSAKIDCYAMYTNNAPCGPSAALASRSRPLPSRATWTSWPSSWALIRSNCAASTA